MNIYFAHQKKLFNKINVFNKINAFSNEGTDVIPSKVLQSANLEIVDLIH